jgi:hypothetical protein
MSLPPLELRLCGAGSLTFPGVVLVGLNTRSHISLEQGRTARNVVSWSVPHDEAMSTSEAGSFTVVTSSRSKRKTKAADDQRTWVERGVGGGSRRVQRSRVRLKRRLPSPLCTAPHQGCASLVQRDAPTWKRKCNFPFNLARLLCCPSLQMWPREGSRLHRCAAPT